MRNQQIYEFSSAKGCTVTVTTRLGEDAARVRAMEHLWGPPRGIYANRGTGLILVRVGERPSPAREK